MINETITMEMINETITMEMNSYSQKNLSVFCELKYHFGLILVENQQNLQINDHYFIFIFLVIHHI